MASWWQKLTGRGAEPAANVAVSTRNSRPYEVQGDPTLLRIANSLDNALTGNGTAFDFSSTMTAQGGWINPAWREAELYRSYKNEWCTRKIVDIPVEDILREGWTYDGLTQEQDDMIRAASELLGVMTAFNQAMRLERLFGGAAIFMGIADDAPASMPVYTPHLDRGALKFLNVLPRSQCTPAQMEANPLSPRYGKPEQYWVGGKMVHHSRLIIFDGSPLMPVPSMIMGNFSADVDGYGDSVIESLYDDIVRATGTRQAAMQLVQRAGAFLAYADLMSLEGTTQGEKAKQTLKDVVNYLNVFRGAVLHKDSTTQGDPIATITPSFGSVPELVTTFLVVLSASGDIPATRFLGQAPGGLNSTGESDLENYYGRLESAQTEKLTPKIRQLVAVLGPSVFGRGFEWAKVKPSFPPLWSLSATEQATVRTSDTTNIMTLWDAGLITDDQAVAELKNRDVLSPDFDDVTVFSDLAPAVGDPNAQLAAAKAALARLNGNPNPQ